MILDSGVFFSERTSVCLLGRCVLIGYKSTFECVSVHVIDGNGHSLLHSSVEEGRKKSYLERIADDPLLILREKGCTKINLKLYVSFVTKGRYKSKVGGTRRQRIILSIINGERDIWTRIMKTDPSAYHKLHDALGIDVDTKSQDTSVKEELENISRNLNEKPKKDGCESEAICEILQSDGNLLDETGFILRVHHDFCIPINRKGFVDDFDKEYTKMVNSILYGDLSDKLHLCLVSHPFYNEIEVFNSFVQCKRNLSLFNRESLEKDIFHSITERGIRDYILNKVEEFHLNR